MNKYNPNIHQRRSIRLKGYDYAREGLYFITICCENRICHFGNIINGEMILNEFGMIAFNEWIKTPEIRPNVELCEFIIMPNHMHGIIRLGRGELHSPHNTDSPHNTNSPHNTDSPHNTGECNSPLPPLRSPSQTIGAIVRGYKSSVTKQMGLGYSVWQRNYYEHIIRNEQSYQNITNYIINNPAKWAEDKFYSNNV